MKENKDENNKKDKDENNDVKRGNKYDKYTNKIPVDKGRYSGEIFEKRIGNKVKGKLIDVLDNVGRYGYKLYIIDGDRLDGKHDKIFGCKSLDRQMKNILIGDIIEVEYLGKKVTQFKQYHEFEVSKFN